jgi:hypothetical protein
MPASVPAGQGRAGLHDPARPAGDADVADPRPGRIGRAEFDQHPRRAPASSPVLTSSGSAEVEGLMVAVSFICVITCGCLPGVCGIAAAGLKPEPALPVHRRGVCPVPWKAHVGLLPLVSGSCASFGSFWPRRPVNTAPNDFMVTAPGRDARGLVSAVASAQSVDNRAPALPASSAGPTRGNDVSD